MRPLSRLLVVSALVSTSCAGPGVAGAASLLRAASPSGSARLDVEGSALVEVDAPLAFADLPARVARMVEAIEPGGEPVEVARVRTARGDGWRVTKRYGEDVAGRVRTVCLDAQNNVIERSHEIPLAEVHAAARDKVLAAHPGEVQRVDAVQGEAGAEGYRFWLARGGERWVVECRLTGAGMRAARVLVAELWVRTR